MLPQIDAVGAGSQPLDEWPAEEAALGWVLDEPHHEEPGDAGGGGRDRGADGGAGWPEWAIEHEEPEDGEGQGERDEPGGMSDPPEDPGLVNGNDHAAYDITEIIKIPKTGPCRPEMG